MKEADSLEEINVDSTPLIWILNRENVDWSRGS